MKYNTRNTFHLSIFYFYSYFFWSILDRKTRYMTAAMLPAPNTNTWKTLLPMPSGRHGLGSSKYKSKVHLFGGGPNPDGGGSNTHSIFFIGK